MSGVKGSFTGVLRHADGTEEIVKKDNLVLSAGYDLIFDRLFQIQAGEQYNSNKALQYIAVGTGTNAPAAEQTATFGTGQAIGAITEAAVCYRNGTSAIDNNTHVAFDRVVFPAINKGREDVYTCTFWFVFGELKE